MQGKIKKMREMKKEQGFTLMEMLIVVMIMGFLVAMIAPRFTDMFSGAQKTLCKKNQQTVSNALSTFVADTGSLPDNLTSIVGFDGTNYSAPSEYNGKNATTQALTDGNDVVKKFSMKNAMNVHILSASEASEIQDLGITTIRPFHQNSTTEDYYFGDETSVEAGVGVLMVAAGAADATGDVAPYNYPGAGNQWGLEADRHLINPEMAYRIVLGLGPDNEMVTSGHVDQAGTSMGEAKESKPFKYVYHSVVLPRLKSTVDRLASSAPIAIKVEGYDEPGGTKVKGISTITLNKVQDPTNYGLLAACGERWQERSEKNGLAVWRITDVTTP